MSKIYTSIDQLIGNTPLLKLNRIVPEDAADVYVKLEFFNPAGSIKDRIALSMIEKAEADAEAKRIAAEGEADANKILADSLSDDIFKQMMLEKWDGQLPKVTDSGSNVFDVTGLLGEEEDGSQGTDSAEAGQ